jgi:hypothetical protein
MGIQWRPMRPKDVRECVGIVAAHPVLGPRYGSAIHELNSVWLGLLGREAFRAVVFEEVIGAKEKILGAGVSAFVRDEFFEELKKVPRRWVGPAITERIVHDQSPLLSDKETREANADGGLNLLVWEGIVRTEDFLRVEVNVAAVSAFVEQHRGFLLKEVLSQCVNVEQLLSSVHGGTMFLDADGQYVDSLPCLVEEALAKPHFIGMTRQLALSRAGSWIGSIFLYQPARFGFRPSEQRLLLTALRGGTDPELADELGVSLSAVKKSWALIYERVSPHLQGFSSCRDVIEGISERGKEKKQRLLCYLRDHPEELRPASM